MFRLVSIEDTLQVAPRLFSLDRFDALENEVNRKYANTILSGVGVCIALWDFVKAGDDRLMPHTGFSNTKCTFRLLVFAPVAGEVLWGYVHRANADGVTLDLDFLGGLSILKGELPGTASFDKEEGAWKIAFPSEAEEGNVDDGPAEGDGEEGTVNMLDAGNAVAFSVLKVTFTDGDDQRPEDPSKVGPEPEPIMTIAGTMKESGLGRYEWWEVPEEQEEDDEEGEGGEYEEGQDGDGEYDEGEEAEEYEELGKIEEQASGEGTNPAEYVKKEEETTA